jgi:hypothetical protein
MDRQVLSWLLFLFGIGFLAANLKIAVDYWNFCRLRRFTLLTWSADRPRYYNFSLALAVMLGALLVFRVVMQRRLPDQLFGEAMMFIYFSCALPLSTRIKRGFYKNGVWSDTGFMRWAQISAVSWREKAEITLLLVPRLKASAQLLVVPSKLYGEARRMMRDKIKTREIRIGGMGIDLGSRDEQDAV